MRGPQVPAAAGKLVPALIAGAVIVPIVNPWAPGPSPQVMPLLVGGLCISVLLLLFNRRHVGAVAWGWLIAALASAVFALIQYFGLTPHFEPWINRSEAGQAYANLRQRNQLATIENMGLAALLWIVRRRWCQRGQIPWRCEGAVAGFACLLLAAGNAASASRIGLVQLVALTGLACAWAEAPRKRTLPIAFGTLLAYLCASLLLPWLVETIHGVEGQTALARFGQQEGCWSRRVLWANVAHLISLAPWAGWGWGNLDYAHYITLYPGERFCDILDNAHNLPMHLAVELGVPAALLTCGAMAWLVARAAPWRAADPDHRLAWMVLAVIGLHSLVEYPLWYAPFQTAAGLALALVVLMPHRLEAGSSRRKHTLRCGLAAALSVAVVLAWHDYRAVSQAYLPYESRDAGTRDLPAHAPPPWSPFRDYALFAATTTTPLSTANAKALAAAAEDLLDYSPEPKVIEILIESLLLAGRDAEATFHAARYRAAFPDHYAAWKAEGQALRGR